MRLMVETMKTKLSPIQIAKIVSIPQGEPSNSGMPALTPALKSRSGEATGITTAGIGLTSASKQRSSERGFFPFRACQPAARSRGRPPSRISMGNVYKLAAINLDNIGEVGSKIVDKS